MTEPNGAPAPDTAPPASEAGEGKTFTQDDLDRIVNDRLSRERGKFKDYDDLKAKAAERDKLLEATQSETEKAVAAARKETEAAIRAEVTRERVLDRVEVLAAKDFADAEDARLRLQARADEFVGKDGTVDAAAISTALAQLLKDKPHLAAQATGRPRGNADQGPRGSAPSDPGPGINRMRAAYSTNP